jgi:hypothetical protein
MLPERQHIEGEKVQRGTRDDAGGFEEHAQHGHGRGWPAEDDEHFEHSIERHREQEAHNPRDRDAGNPRREAERREMRGMAEQSLDRLPRNHLAHDADLIEARRLVNLVTPMAPRFPEKAPVLKAIALDRAHAKKLEARFGSHFTKIGFSL